MLSISYLPPFAASFVGFDRDELLTHLHLAWKLVHHRSFSFCLPVPNQEVFLFYAFFDNYFDSDNYFFYFEFAHFYFAIGCIILCPFGWHFQVSEPRSVPNHWLFSSHNFFPK